MIRIKVLSYFIHSVCYVIGTIFLIAAVCLALNINPIDYYKNAAWAENKSPGIIEENKITLAQTIIDVKAAYEAKLAEEARIAAEQQAAAAAENEADIASAKESAKTVSASYATLYVDRLGMAVPIYYGDDKATLRKGPGQYTGSSLPGEGSQILIAGHNTSHFKPLQNIEIGDVIRVVTTYGEFHYQVVSTKVASMNDTTTYNLTLDHEQLALYTCYPFTGPPGKTERFFVYADLIN